MQALIIAVALASACFFSAMLARFRFWRGGFLVMSVIDLLCVAGYEIYMHTVWENISNPKTT
jgi:hypothetical protein